MVSKIFGFLYKETKSLNQAAFLLGLFAFLSQILAFLRDRLLAHIFGAGEALDIYYAAFRIPDFIFVTAASVVSISVLVPFIMEEELRGRESLRHFINNIFSFFSVLIIVVSAIAFFLIPAISEVLFKGFNPEALAETVFISRLLLLSPIILGFSNLFGSLTQAYQRFTVYALTPVLYNAGIIVGIMALANKFGILGIAIGVIAGALLHLFIQIPFVLKLGLFPKRPSFGIDFSVIRRVVTISLPRTLTLSMTALSTIFLLSLASLMPPGSISIFSFATHLAAVPLSLIGVSYSLAAFPTLSRRFREKNIEGFKEQMRNTTRFIIFWTLPLSALFVVLRAQIVRVVLGTGEFAWDDTRLVAAALAIFAVSALAQCLILLFMRGFYSAGFTRKPFFINLISTAIMFVLAWGSVKLFYTRGGMREFLGALLRVEDVSGIVVLVLPLAFSIATILNAIFLWYSLEKEFKGFSKGILRTFLDCLGSSVVMAAVAYVSLNIFANFLDTATLLGILLEGVLAGLVASIAGMAVLIALKNREIAEVWNAIRQKFWKAKIIATDPEIV